MGHFKHPSEAAEENREQATRRIVMEEKIKKLWEETRELSLGSRPEIPRVETPPTPLQFLRDYVSPNKPFIISSSPTLDCPATTLWSSPDYLMNTLSSSPVSLHLTPSGNADSLTPLPHSPPSLCFASPHVQKLPFSHALSKIKNSRLGLVAYAQQQNDCLREEYSAVSGDIQEHIGWATQALGCKPDAVNLWIGNHFSQTWFHKDHYENLYAVVTGEKHFLLLPPTDVHRMYIRDYPAANYHYSKVNILFHFHFFVWNLFALVPFTSFDQIATFVYTE